MIKLNKLTDYAVVILTRLHTRKRPMWTANLIACETGVPLPTVAKLIKILVKAEMLSSQRGARGGCTLAQPAHKITVADVIKAVEGPIALTDCVDGGAGECGVENICPMRGNWEQVNVAIRTALEAVTIADMAVPFYADEFINAKDRTKRAEPERIEHST